MKLKAFAIFDNKAQAFLTPWFLPTEQMAIRVFADCANNKDHEFGRNPADYTLFRLAEFDSENGIITMHVHGIEAVHNALVLVRQPRPQPELPLAIDTDNPFKKRPIDPTAALFNGKGDQK